MHRAVASASEDGVAAQGDGVTRLSGGFGLPVRGLDGGADSGLLQHRQCRLYIRHSAPVPPSRERVVKKNGSAHE